MLSNDGDQIPEIPFVDNDGKAVKVAPVHIGSTAVNEGIILEFTVILIVKLHDLYI